MCKKRPIYKGPKTELNKISDDELLNYVRKYGEILPEYECTTSNLASFLKFEYGIVDHFTYDNKGLRNRLNYIQDQSGSLLHCKCASDSCRPRYFIWSVA